ncbi:hypothetical protein RFUL19S_01833 [Rhizobacter fulvus]
MRCARGSWRATSVRGDAGAPAFKERAISWVLAGGILGAVAGPNLASLTRDALPVPFAGAYAALVVVALLALLTISFIGFPPLPKPSAAAPARPLREIARQPVFIVAGSIVPVTIAGLAIAWLALQRRGAQNPVST